MNRPGYPIPPQRPATSGKLTVALIAGAVGMIGGLFVGGVVGLVAADGFETTAVQAGTSSPSQAELDEQIAEQVDEQVAEQVDQLDEVVEEETQQAVRDVTQDLRSQFKAKLKTQEKRATQSMSQLRRQLTAAREAAVKKAVALARSDERAKASVQSFASTAPAASGGTDPRFSYCYEAVAAGYGPYSRGDVEYGWYQDADGDGTVCE